MNLMDLLRPVIRKLVFAAWNETMPCPDGNRAGDFCPSCLADQIEIQIARIIDNIQSKETND